MRDIKEIENRYEQRQNARGKINILKKRYIFLLILLIAVITNPGKERYKSKMIEIVNASMGISQYPNEGSIQSEDVLLNQISESYVHYSNYLLFSTISVDYKGSSKVVGAGFFGFVYIPDQLEEVLRDRN